MGILINNKTLANILLELNETLKEFNLIERRFILNEMLRADRILEQDNEQDALFEAKKHFRGTN